jgi:transcriptional regulator with XRE-family HTH domain
MTEAETNFQTNLRRLIGFEHRSGREAAIALGVTERTVSQWLTGKRYPSGQGLAAIDKLYGISPRELDLDPVDFAQRLADPERMNYVAIGGRLEHVVPIKRRKSS